MTSADWSDDFTLTCYYDPPRPADEPCEETPVPNGGHVRSLVSDKCIFCKRDVER